MVQSRGHFLYKRKYILQRNSLSEANLNKIMTVKWFTLTDMMKNEAEREVIHEYQDREDIDDFMKNIEDREDMIV